MRAKVRKSLSTSLTENMNKPDVLILCGGLGTRIRRINSQVPKVLLPINGKPFLYILLNQLIKQHFNRIILGIGYQADAVKDYVKKEKFDADIVISQETELLGTGGAVKLAQTHLKSDHFLVINGDSLCDVDYAAFYNFHLKNQALCSMVVTMVDDCSDYGTLDLDQESRVTAFFEKDASRRQQWVNAGRYYFSKNIFDYMNQQKKFSLELDIFPELIKHAFFGFKIDQPLIDIGTPERYFNAQDHHQ